MRLLLEFFGNFFEIVSYGYEIVVAGGYFVLYDENLFRKKKKVKIGRFSGELERERIFMVLVKYLDVVYLKFLGFLFI